MLPWCSQARLVHRGLQLQIRNLLFQTTGAFLPSQRDDLQHEVIGVDRRHLDWKLLSHTACMCAGMRPRNACVRLTRSGQAVAGLQKLSGQSQRDHALKPCPAKKVILVELLDSPPRNLFSLGEERQNASSILVTSAIHPAADSTHPPRVSDGELRGGEFYFAAAASVSACFT